LAEAENISRKIITRCMNTARLPREIIALFSHPGELSARSGDLLSRLLDGREEELLDIATGIAARKAQGEQPESSEIIRLLSNVRLPDPATKQMLKKHYIPGAYASYQGNRVIVNLDRKRLPAGVIEKIEAILEGLENS
ncbi:plasmid-partitioning protein, partial [Enterobacter ludwigii]